MRTFRFNVNEGQEKAINVDFVPPTGTLGVRVIATSSSGSSQTLADAASIAGSVITLAIPASWNVYANYPSKFEVQLQVNGGAWYTEVEAYGYLIVAATPSVESTQLASLQTTTAGLTTSVALKSDKVNINGLPIWLYGNSATLLSSAWFTAGNHYANQIASQCGGGTVTSYGVGGRRILDVVSTMLTGANWNGTNGVLSAGVWTSTTNRTGLIILDALGNDTAHYSSMVAGASTPSKITGTGGTNFLNGQKLMWRAALALASSESRIESSTGTYSSGWSADTAFTGFSGGSFRSSTTVGSTATFSVTAPKKGPLAGKVFLMMAVYDPAYGVTSSNFSVAVDGGTAVAYTPGAWERYVGHAGTNVDFIPAAFSVDVPADGAAHSVVITHTGSAGQGIVIDTILIPSETPNAIIVPAFTVPFAVSGVFTQASINNWGYNLPLHEAAVKSVVAEFPNAAWATCSLTPNGQYSLDGTHPNDRGMKQRANDIIEALQNNFRARYKNLALSAQANSNFSIL